MPRDVDYKPFLSISIPADQRQLFYRSLVQIRQHYPFATKSALVVQAVIAAAQQEQQLLELLAQLPQAVQITQQEGPIYTWYCAGNQGSASSLLQRFRKRLVPFCGLSPLLLSTSLLLPVARVAALPNGEGRR
jgi:hypothetical protein